MKRSRRTFTEEYKREAVRLVVQEKQSVSTVARDLGLDPKMLRRWRREVEREGTGAFPGKGHQKPELEEVSQLRQEIERLRMEREILKKALTIFSAVEGPSR